MIEFSAVTMPLEENEMGVIHVAGTRVTLDSVLHAYFNDGATVEEIIVRFPTCALEDVYAVVAWALNYPATAQAYLARQAERRAALEAELETQLPSREWNGWHGCACGETRRTAEHAVSG